MLNLQSLIVGVEMPESHPWDAANVSAPCRLAVRQAFEIASAMKRPVHLVSVLPEFLGGYFGSQVDQDLEKNCDTEEAMLVLNELVQRETERVGACEARCSVLFGSAWLELLKLSLTDRDNLVICGTREQGAMSRFLFGSTGLKLLRHAECPVWLVKPRIDDDAELDILCATDLSDVSEDVVFAAVALSQHVPSKLNVVHVVDHEPQHRVARANITSEKLAELQQRATDQAEAMLHDQISMTDYRTLDNGLQAHIKTGPASKTLLQTIEELDIDVLVMATRASEGLSGIVFGNTAEQLLSEVPCSVLAIKPESFQCPILFDADSDEEE